MSDEKPNQPVPESLKEAQEAGVDYFLKKIGKEYGVFKRDKREGRSTFGEGVEVYATREQAEADVRSRNAPAGQEAASPPVAAPPQETPPSEDEQREQLAAARGITAETEDSAPKTPAAAIKQLQTITKKEWNKLKKKYGFENPAELAVLGLTLKGTGGPVEPPPSQDTLPIADVSEGKPAAGGDDAGTEGVLPAPPNTPAGAVDALTPNVPGAETAGPESPEAAVEPSPLVPGPIIADPGLTGPVPKAKAEVPAGEKPPGTVAELPGNNESLGIGDATISPTPPPAPSPDAKVETGIKEPGAVIEPSVQEKPADVDASPIEKPVDLPAPDAEPLLPAKAPGRPQKPVWETKPRKGLGAIDRTPAAALGSLGGRLDPVEKSSQQTGGYDPSMSGPSDEPEGTGAPKTASVIDEVKGGFGGVKALKSAYASLTGALSEQTASVGTGARSASTMGGPTGPQINVEPPPFSRGAGSLGSSAPGRMGSPALDTGESDQGGPDDYWRPKMGGLPMPGAFNLPEVEKPSFADSGMGFSGETGGGMGGGGNAGQDELLKAVKELTDEVKKNTEELRRKSENEPGKEGDPEKGGHGLEELVKKLGGGAGAGEGAAQGAGDAAQKAMQDAQQQAMMRALTMAAAAAL